MSVYFSVEETDAKLVLEATTAKVVGYDIRRIGKRLGQWTSPSTLIYWDVRFPSVGPIYVDVAFSSETKGTVQFRLGGDEIIEQFISSSGGWDIVTVYRMGTVTVKKPGKYQATLRPIEIHEHRAADIFYLILSGPGVLGAREANVFPPWADAVHLWFGPENAMMIYNEIIVDKSHWETYFMACGFAGGCFGIQENSPEEGRALFALWDISDSVKVSVVRKGEDVKVNRVEGEGCGYQSLYPFDWETKALYRFLVTADLRDDFTIYTGYIYLQSRRQWKLISSLKRLTRPYILSGYYAFIEELNHTWGNIARQVSLNPWYRNKDGHWFQINEATFTRTGDHPTVNGWVQDDWFYLKTGGATVNVTPSHGTIKREVHDPVPSCLNDIDIIITQELFLP